MQIIAFIALFLSGLYLPLWVFAVIGFAYALIWSAPSVFIVALVIDVQFSDPGNHIYALYTLTACVSSIMAYSIRPLLRFTRDV
jgi:hypothetical protein